MLHDRDESDVKHQAEARALRRVARSAAPGTAEVYQHDQTSPEDLIQDAIIDQHWAALPALQDWLRLPADR
jgi:hypothetical protein